MREAIIKRNLALQNVWYIYQVYFGNGVDIYGVKRYVTLLDLQQASLLVTFYEARIQES